MTRKDFEKIAAVFSAHRAHNANFATYAVRDAITNELSVRIANMLERDNPAFKRPLFLTACGSFESISWKN